MYFKMSLPVEFAAELVVVLVVVLALEFESV